MTTLSSLIVARQAASIAQVDEALARQVVRGGDLGTCVLELGMIGERELLALLAEAYGCEVVGPGELSAAPPPALRLVPPAVALRYGIYPLEERGGELHVAVAEPLPQPVEDDLGFALGTNLRQFVAPLVRIRQAIARDYGLPLERRFARLVAKLERRPDPSPSDIPPRADQTPPFPGGGVRLSKSGTMIVDSAVPPPAPPLSEQTPQNLPQQRIIAPPTRRNTWPGMAAAPPEEASVQIPKPARTPSTPPEIVPSPASPAVAPRAHPTIAFEAPQPTAEASPAATAATAEPQATPKPPSAKPERRPTTGPPPAFVLEAMAATAAQVEKRRRRRAEQASGKALLGWARRTLGNVIPSDRGPERKRGPLTPAAAEHQLEDAATGEQALAIFFAFARQYFEYSALFMVHGDLAAGHDASGPGATGDKVRAIGVALDLPSALSYAKDRGTPTLLTLKRTGLDADLRSDLARSAAHEVLMLPIVMRGRCVALLYGDDGEQPVSHGEIGDVVAMASLLTTMLERILLRKKRAALRDPSAVKSKKSSVDRSSISASDPGAAPVSVPPAGLGDLAAKRGGWSEEELVDDGWTVPADVEPERSSVRPSPVPAKRSPPPPQVAAVRPIAKQPIRREETEDSPPELIISEAEDAAEMSELLTEIEQNPSPGPPPAALRSLSALVSPELVRRPVDPMASASFSAAPHPPPPPSQGPFRNLPSVLIRSDLVDQVIAGGDKAEKALSEILALGEAAIPSVFARFPGPLTVDRNQALGELPRPADCGPVLRIVAAMRRLALPFLAVRSADSDVEVRFWATYLLGELNYSDAAQALLPRLFDENPTVRRIAVRSSRSLVASGEQGAPIRKTLERMISQTDEPQQRRLIALSTIGELKLYRSIPVLIQVLSDPADAIADAALRSLVAMTRQEYGKDRKKWTEWWETKGKKRLA